ncbi:MAG: 2TM domain-containing protein [Verrucomicrobia bacterium]|nr:2TM domain-containing protein [Verrucomicrobiota bacterium]MBS0645528.1 2TM domain-containing protein [Verrucomicrobiota bacterium]
MDENDPRYKKARARVARLRGFYTNLISYVSINILLLIINLLTSPRSLWFYWVAAIWGIVLVIQGLSLFTIKDSFLGEEWEKRKIRDILNRDKHD